MDLGERLIIDNNLDATLSTVMLLSSSLNQALLLRRLLALEVPGAIRQASALASQLRLSQLGYALHGTEEVRLGIVHSHSAD